MPIDILSEIERDCGAEAAQAMIDLAVEYLAETRERDGRVSTPQTPAKLAERFAEPLPREGRSLDDVVARLRNEVIPDCNHLYHPRYVGHQVSAPLPAAVWSDALISALNQSVAVWEMSPVATVLEHRVMRWMCDLLGWNATAGGTMTTGGTEATFTALLAARAAALPDAWTNGVGERPPLLVCGEHAHYAVTRAAGELGIGMRSVVSVRAKKGAMDVEALRAALDSAASDGRGVMAVVATAGSTATGAFDDLEAIGVLCDARGVWLHVDGAHGASALLSQRRRHCVKGIERARSIAWDPHKMMLLPLQAGMVLVRDERALDGAFAQRAPYLFHGSGDERVLDQGVRSFLCSRRADVIKVWVALQRYGANGIGALYDRLCDTTAAMYDAINDRPRFQAMHEPACNILCFRWLGGRPADDPALDEVNRVLRERYNRSGDGWITTTMLDGRRVLRVTIMNPRTTPDDTVAILDSIEKMATAG